MLKTKDILVNYEYFNPIRAVVDVSISHVDYRVLSYLIELDRKKISWNKKLWRELGEELYLDRATVRKCCYNLLKTKYLKNK